MPEASHRAGLFPALLKHWRGQRGLSQLDLALAADVSARHISFLETGRAAPSEGMVLRLAATLGVPLRHTNAMLQAAGHAPAYSTTEDALPPVVAQAVSLLKDHQEPYPLIVLDRTYQICDLNGGARALLGALVGVPLPEDAGAVAALGLNLARLTFDPHGAQPLLANFSEVGRALLWRLQREVLASPEDTALAALLDEILAMPTVEPGWREVDLSVRSEPALIVHLRRDALELRFLTLVTVFQAPQNVLVEELRIEAWFPCDPATAAACRALTATHP